MRIMLFCLHPVVISGKVHVYGMALVKMTPVLVKIA